MLSFDIHTEVDEHVNATFSFCLDKDEAVCLPDGRTLTRATIVRMVELGFKDRLKLFISKGGWSL